MASACTFGRVAFSALCIIVGKVLRVLFQLPHTLHFHFADTSTASTTAPVDGSARPLALFGAIFVRRRMSALERQNPRNALFTPHSGGSSRRSATTGS